MVKAHGAYDVFVKTNPSGSEGSDGKPARYAGVKQPIKTMPDDKTKKGPEDASRINIHEPYEVQYWHQKFDVTPQQLRDAVKEVGVMVEDVREYLKK